MTKNWIKLTSAERKIIEIEYLRNKQLLSSKFNWKEIVWPILFLLIDILLYLIIQSTEWLFILVGVACFLNLYESIKSWPNSKANAIKRDAKIKPLLNYDSVEVQECQCTRALKLSHDESALYLLEIAPNKTLVYLDYYDEMTALLPNSKFSFFLDEALSETLGNNIKLSGSKFMPYRIEIHPLELESINLLPKHLEILNYSIDSFLDKLKKEYSE